MIHNERKAKKGDLEYHPSVLYHEIIFEWSAIEFRYQDVKKENEI